MAEDRGFHRTSIALIVVNLPCLKSSAFSRLFRLPVDRHMFLIGRTVIRDSCWLGDASGVIVRNE